MNKQIILVLVLIALIGGYVVFSNTQTDVKDWGTPLVTEEAVVTGTVVEVDRSQLMLDGPTLVTIVTDEEQSEVVAVPSMGINLCEAVENISDVSQLAVGDVVAVTGSRDENDFIVPCADATDKLIVTGKALDTVYGYEFSYRKGPDGYITLEDNESSHKDFVTGLMLVNASEYEELMSSQDAREGLPAMRLRIYENPQKQFASVWVQNNQSEVNYQLKLGEESEAVVGGANAVYYKADGLFTTDVYVIAHDSRIYVLMGDYFDVDSAIERDFGTLVDSFTFVPTPAQVGGGAKINPQVACESALAYMSFPSGAEADAFVSDCVNGEHPEVIERFIQESGLDGARI
ncbi:MAG: hypothetical protein R3B53_02490 [Candidatus Paceibacterota bacterium]